MESSIIGNNFLFFRELIGITWRITKDEKDINQ